MKASVLVGRTAPGLRSTRIRGRPFYVEHVPRISKILPPYCWSANQFSNFNALDQDRRIGSSFSTNHSLARQMSASLSEKAPPVTDIAEILGTGRETRASVSSNTSNAIARPFVPVESERRHTQIQSGDKDQRKSSKNMQKTISKGGNAHHSRFSNQKAIADFVASENYSQLLATLKKYARNDQVEKAWASLFTAAAQFPDSSACVNSASHSPTQRAVVCRELLEAVCRSAVLDRELDVCVMLLCYRKALSFAEERELRNFKLYQNVSRLLSKHGEAKTLAAVTAAALELFPQRAVRNNILQPLLVCYAEQGDVERAEDVLHKMFELGAPLDVYAANALINLYGGLKRWKRAQHVYSGLTGGVADALVVERCGDKDGEIQVSLDETSNALKESKLYKIQGGLQQGAPANLNEGSNETTDELYSCACSNSELQKHNHKAESQTYKDDTKFLNGLASSQDAENGEKIVKRSKTMGNCSEIKLSLRGKANAVTYANTLGAAIDCAEYSSAAQIVASIPEDLVVVGHSIFAPWRLTRLLSRMMQGGGSAEEVWTFYNVCRTKLRFLPLADLLRQIFACVAKSGDVARMKDILEDDELLRHAAVRQKDIAKMYGKALERALKAGGDARRLETSEVEVVERLWRVAVEERALLLPVRSLLLLLDDLKRRKSDAEFLRLFESLRGDYDHYPVRRELWNHALLLYASAGDEERFQHVVKELSSVGHNFATFQAWMKLCAGLGDIQRAKAQFHAFVQDPQYARRYRMLDAYNELLDLFAEAECLHTAEQETETLLAEMQNKGIELNLVSHNVLLKLYARSAGTDKTTRGLARMLAQGLRPNGRSFSILLESFLRAGDRDGAARVLGKVHRNAAVRLQPRDKVQMLKACVEHDFSGPHVVDLWSRALAKATHVSQDNSSNNNNNNTNNNNNNNHNNNNYNNNYNNNNIHNNNNNNNINNNIKDSVIRQEYSEFDNNSPENSVNNSTVQEVSVELNDNNRTVQQIALELNNSIVRQALALDDSPLRDRVRAIVADSDVTLDAELRERLFD